MSPLLLYVDDSPHMLQVRKANLERLGFQVVTATNAPSALRTLETTAVTAVLLDYRREGLDAEAVAFHIKQRFPRTPVLLLSAYANMPERILWLVDEYMMKSEPMERLRDVVERMTRSADAMKNKAAA